MSAKIDRRHDVNPDRGEKQYGDVEFADPANNKYPIDTPKHIRAAWSYINDQDHVANPSSRCRAGADNANSIG